jgi:hypothetical protein
VCLIICIAGGFLVPFTVAGQVYLDVPGVQQISSNDFKFNQSKAFELVKKQVDLGPRYPGSEGIGKTRLLIQNELLEHQEWTVIYQNFSKQWLNDQNITIVNMICLPKGFNSSEEVFILLAHYDTRLWADSDPDPQKHTQPVPGANDGASGVAVILEIGQILVEYNITNFILLFVDAEDQGNIGGWNWILGSKFFVESPEFHHYNFSFGILLDMVGAEGATFLREKNSDKYANDLVETVWNSAKILGYDDYFLNRTGRLITDDHVPFLTKGIPVIDIIDDFSDRYDSWHTTSDDLTKISAVTLGVVGQTLETVLVSIANTSNLLSDLTRFTYQSSFFPIDTGILPGLAVLVIFLGATRRKKYVKQ